MAENESAKTQITQLLEQLKSGASADSGKIMAEIQSLIAKISDGDQKKELTELVKKTVESLKGSGEHDLSSVLEAGKSILSSIFGKKDE